MLISSFYPQPNVSQVIPCLNRISCISSAATLQFKMHKTQSITVLLHAQCHAYNVNNVSVSQLLKFSCSSVCLFIKRCEGMCALKNENQHTVSGKMEIRTNSFSFETCQHRSFRFSGRERVFLPQRAQAVPVRRCIRHMQGLKHSTLHVWVNCVTNWRKKGWSRRQRVNSLLDNTMLYY